MPFSSWRSAAQFEQSSAIVLIAIGLAGFLIDLLLKPISAAGLVLLLLAATPSLVTLLKRRHADVDRVAETHDAPAKTTPAAGLPQRASMARAAAPESSKAAPIASPAQTREAHKERVVPAAVRAGSENRPAEPGRPAAKATPAPEPEPLRTTVLTRAARQAGAEPSRSRADAPVATARRPGEPLRTHPNAL